MPRRRSLRCRTPPQVQTAVSQVAAQVPVLVDKPVDDAGVQAPLAALPAKITSASRTGGGPDRNGQYTGQRHRCHPACASPARCRPAADSFPERPGAVTDIDRAGPVLYNALDAIVGQPAQLGALFSDPGQLKTRVEADVAIRPFSVDAGQRDLLAGAPRKVILRWPVHHRKQVLGGTADLLAGGYADRRRTHNPFRLEPRDRQLVAARCQQGER